MIRGACHPCYYFVASAIRCRPTSFVNLRNQRITAARLQRAPDEHRRRCARRHRAAAVIADDDRIGRGAMGGFACAIITPMQSHRRSFLRECREKIPPRFEIGWACAAPLRTRLDRCATRRTNSAARPRSGAYQSDEDHAVHRSEPQTTLGITLSHRPTVPEK